MKSPEKVLLPPYHPLLANPTLDEVMKLCETEDGRVKYASWLEQRAKRIKLAEIEEGDPYRYAWELDQWKLADEELKLCGKGQYVAGGKRATKTERNALRCVQALTHLPRSRMWALQGSSKTGIAEQHSRIWKYLPIEIRAMNGRSRHGMAKIDYTVDRGFANNILVLPNLSELHFLTYNMDPGEYQGWELGAPLNDELREKIAANPWLHNIGAWMDEDAPLPWVETVQTRCTTRDAVWMWTFSTLHGITQAIQAIRGTPEVIETRRAELLQPDVVHVPGCPPGHMPVRERASGGVSIFYFWTEFNPFPPNYENLKELVAGKPAKRIMRDAYGFDESVQNRAYPKFGRWNIIKASELPEQGTNYFITDPAGARMWSGIWVRVAPGNPSKFYIYRDFPPRSKFGDWAVPSPRHEEQPDGIEGTAQRTHGWGFPTYKAKWLEAEKIPCPPDLLDRAEKRDEVTDEEIEAALTKAKIMDPQRRKRFAQCWRDGVDINEISEELNIAWSRIIDSRAGKDSRSGAEGNTTAIIEMAKEHRNPSSGALIAPPMYFRLAAGVLIETGITAVNALLDWDQDAPLCPLVNEPRLYVTEECEQVIQMFEVYTGRGGEKGGWKDISDLVRYMATSRLEYINSAATQTRGCGGY